MPAIVVVGAQWGDEGKAKVIDHLAEDADLVVRYQGGCNAGHTVVKDGQTFKFHLIPSGILYPGKTCIVGPGTVIYPEVFAKELETLHQHNLPLGRLCISPRAHLTMPYHLALDEAKEKALGDGKIGTTKRGIGPSYEDKVSRVGLRVGDLLLSDEQLKTRLEQVIQQKNSVMEGVYELPKINLDELMAVCQNYRAILKPYITNVDGLLQEALKQKNTILLEGAQGTMLDLDHGTYPYVTSSNPCAGGACTGAGIGPTHITEVIGVAKAYTTRVGDGPFPTELMDETGKTLAEVGVEFGTTTGRPRRCGWLDAVALKYAVHINGMTGLAVTKLDVLDALQEIKICKAYRHKETGEMVSYFPSHLQELAQVEPVYETFSGWQGSVKEVRSFDDLPQEAKILLNRLSEIVGVPVVLVGVGPEREQVIVCEKALEIEPVSCSVA